MHQAKLIHLAILRSLSHDFEVLWVDAPHISIVLHHCIVEEYKDDADGHQSEIEFLLVLVVFSKIF